MFGSGLAYTFIMNHKKGRAGKLNELLNPKAVAANLPGSDPVPSLVIKFSEIALSQRVYRCRPNRKI
jgi:hypothetical protein